MARFRDGARSFAIDRFPEMEAGAVEAFHDASVERRRAERAPVAGGAPKGSCGTAEAAAGSAAVLGSTAGDSTLLSVRLTR